MWFLYGYDRWKCIKSCSILAVQCNKKSIKTIESIGKENNLSNVQKAFNENHGLQCGFCTPGFIMTAIECKKNNISTEEEVREFLDGNFCRCTGYQNIVKSIISFLKCLEILKMYKFKYHKPTSLEESINLFKEKEFPKYLSGGMTLIPSMKQLLSSPTDLIDIQDIKELRGIYESENKIIIGALTTHNEVAHSSIIKKILKVYLILHLRLLIMLLEILEL